MKCNISLTFNLSTLEQMQALGTALGKLLVPQTTLLLVGDLGTGKTTLVQSIGAGLGIREAITSPTFALIHEYPEGRIPLYHFDLYRLNPAEADALHPETYWLGLDVPSGITAIEWPERLTQWPEDYLKVELVYQGEIGRSITFTPHGWVHNWEQIEQIQKQIRM